MQHVITSPVGSPVAPLHARTFAPLAAAKFLRALLDSARKVGVDPDAVLATLDVDRDVVDDPTGWIDASVMARAWELVPRLARDAVFGLHAAEDMPLGVYGPLELAVIASATVEIALARVERYYRLLGALTDLRVSRASSGIISVRATPAAPAAQGLRHYYEHMLALIVVRLRAIVVALDPKMLVVTFAHGAPGDTAEHLRVLGPNVRFGAAHNEITLDARAGKLPLRTAQPELAALLERHSAAQELRPDAPTPDRVRRALAQALRVGDASLATVATKLGRAPRSIQRDLQARGTTFAEVLDEVRREAATHYVADGAMALGEIAFLLGFSESSAFHRAFKRWTNTTPRAYRAAIRDQ